MRLSSRLLGIGLTILAVSCSRQKPSKQPTAYDEFMAHMADAEQQFCSTNPAVAEKGLLDYRLWLLNQTNHYDFAVYQTDARLFAFYELHGDTNQAERFYQESALSYEKYLRRNNRSPYWITKEEIRERLSRQQQGQDIGWKKVLEQRH